MDVITLECVDDFDIRCGEIYLTPNGKVELHCTLCEKKFELFQQYINHLSTRHRPAADSTINKKNMGDTVIFIFNDDDSSSGAESIPHLKDLEDFLAQEYSDENSSASMEAHVEVFANIQATNTNQQIKKEIKHLICNQIGQQQIGEKTENMNTYNCPHCHYKGNDKANFRAHIKRHFVENKTKKCPKCPKSFHSTCELKRHILTHTGEKPFLCQECGKGYISKHKLNAHFKRHFNLRDVPCTLCDKSFFSKTALDLHMAVHTDERSYSCGICEATFKLKKCLRTHLKIHDNPFRYKCNHCPARFNQSSGLRSHMKSKHEERKL